MRPPGHSGKAKRKIETETSDVKFWNCLDSDDSEGGLGNVERVVLRLPGH
jgi:hypothetical protein